MIGNFSEITHLPKKLEKVGYILRLSLVFENHCQNPDCQSFESHSNLLKHNRIMKFLSRTYIHDLLLFF